MLLFNPTTTPFVKKPANFNTSNVTIQLAGKELDNGERRKFQYI